MSIHTLYLPTNEYNRIVMTVLLISVHITSRVNIVLLLLCSFHPHFHHRLIFHHFTAMVRLVFFRLNWCKIFAKVVVLREIYHFCSIISVMVRICSNCGIRSVKMDPCECCQVLPQCRKCRRRMPARCFVKSSRPNICEVRHVLSVAIVWSFLALHLNK